MLDAAFEGACTTEEESAAAGAEAARRHNARGGATGDPSAPPDALLACAQAMVRISCGAAERQGKRVLGLGGGALGSEGYGEATMGSVHRIGLALQHLCARLMRGA